MKVSAKKSIGKRALALMLALVLAITAVSVGFIIPSSTQAASAGEGGSARVLASNIDTELDALKSNIDTYEEMMDGEHIYKNMETAYTAYCAACEAYYENYYGYEYDDGATVHPQNVTEVTTANTALANAIENMEQYTGYVGEATTAADGSFTSDSSKATTSTPLLMQKSDTSTTYTTDSKTDKGTNAGVEVKAMGDDHNSIDMYDEMSGVMYTYGVGDNAGHYGPDMFGGSGTFGGNQRINEDEINVGLIYGSVVFLYTGEGKSSGEYFNRTSTYAVPIGAYVDGYETWSDQSTISYIGVNFENSSYEMNGNTFDLHRGWHGFLASSSSHDGIFVSGYVNSLSGSDNKYENHFFGFNEGFGYLSSSSFYDEIYSTSNVNGNGGLLYRSYNTGQESNASNYSNTLYYTGTPKDSVANINTTETESDTDTYYAKYDLLDYTYYNNIGGSSSVGAGDARYRGTQGFYVFIRPDRTKQGDNYSSSKKLGACEYWISNTYGNIKDSSLTNFMSAVQTYEESGGTTTSGFNSGKASPNYNDFQDSNNSNHYSSNTTTTDAQPGGNADSYIYVVDYEPVLTELEEDMQYLNIKNGNYYYRYGSTQMQNILKAFDTVTAYNPNTAFASNSTDATTLDVASTVETVANNLKSYTSTLDSAVSSNVSNGVVQGYDTVSYTVHDMVLTGYDEDTYESNKTGFLNGSAFVTTGTTVGYYTLLSDYVAPTKLETYENTVAGTVGEYTASHDLPTSSLPAGYEWSSTVNLAYYGATEGAQESVTGGFLHLVPASFSSSTATMTAYAANVEFYTFTTPKDIQIRFRYRDNTAGDGVIIKYVDEDYSTHTIEYYKTTFEGVYPETFVYGGIKYVLSTSRGVGSGNLTYTINGEDITFTWDSSHAGGQYEFSIYYEEVPVNVVYTSYSVTLAEGTNQIIDGNASQVDGYVKLTTTTDSDITTTTVNEQPTAAYATTLEGSNTTIPGPVGATAVPNTNTDNGQDASFVRWYLLDKSPDQVSWEDFRDATSVSASWGGNETISPNLVTDLTQAGITDSKYAIENWSTDSSNPTTFYYYALFTAEEPDMSTKHLQVTLMLDDWDENQAAEAGAQFIVTVTDTTTDGQDMDISYVAEIGEGGVVTLTFDVLPGTCVVEINTDFAYGYSLKIYDDDTHNVGDGTQTELVDTSSADSHSLTFHLVYNPLNTAENNSDSKTNNYTGNSTAGSGTEG